MEGAFANVNSTHEEVCERLDLHKKGLKKFVKWQGQCQDTYNKMVLKVTDLEKKDEEKSGQIEILLNKVTELQGMVESMREKLCTCYDCKVICQHLLACEKMTNDWIGNLSCCRGTDES